MSLVRASCTAHRMGDPKYFHLRMLGFRVESLGFRGWLQRQKHGCNSSGHVPVNESEITLNEQEDANMHPS